MRYETPRPVYPNELYHHGIMGQHWGETNGPPYPLGSGTHNRVVRRGRAERKQLKAEYKNARQDVRNSAHQLLAARKEAAKYGSSRNEREQAIARDASAREKFYNEQYKQSLAKYRDAAIRSGGKVKYDENSLKRAAFLAGNHNATGVLAEHAFGLVGAVAANRANNNSIRRWAAGKESQAKFDRFANQKKFAEGKTAAKAAYKEQKSARHTGSSAPKTTKQSSGTSMQRSAATEKNAIMKEMNRRFGNSEQNKEALAELKAELKTTKGTYDKKFGMSTYSTRFGLFDVYYDKNGKIYDVSFND